MRIRWVVSLAVTLGAASTAAAQDSSRAVPRVALEEAIRLALDVHPNMVQARGNARVAGAGVLAATGAFLPSVTANGSATRAGGSRYNSSTNQIVSAPANNTYSGGLSFNMPLFDGLFRISERRAAGATQDAADAALLNQRFAVTLSTRQVYYAAAATEELVRVAEAQVRRAQQQLQIAVEKLRAGSATRSDSLRSTVDYGNARLSLLQAQANLATAEANLGRQIGHDGRVRAIADTVVAPLPDTVGLRASALSSAPSFRQAEANEAAARAAVVSTRSNYWPSLSLGVGTGYSGSEWPWSSLDTYANNWSLRLSVNWTIFNGFGRERQIAVANAARDGAIAQSADVRRQVGALMTQQLAALATAHEQIAIARANLAAATEDLRVQQERYRVGAATILDLLTSQAALTQAEVSVVQRRFDYLVARATLEALVGRSL